MINHILDASVQKLCFGVSDKERYCATSRTTVDG
jgi:hypothetical protein